MRAVAMLAVVLSVFATAPHADEKRPLVVNAEPAWQIDYTDDGIHFFHLTRPEGENIAFTFHKWPGSGGREQVPVYVRRIADNFTKNSMIELVPFIAKQGYDIEGIVGNEFSGEAAVFKNLDRTLLVIFMVSDGDGIWQGQYSGSRATWEKAKTVLQNLQRADRQTSINPRMQDSQRASGPMPATGQGTKFFP